MLNDDIVQGCTDSLGYRFGDTGASCAALSLLTFFNTTCGIISLLLLGSGKIIHKPLPQFCGILTQHLRQLKSKGIAGSGSLAGDKILVSHSHTLAEDGAGQAWLVGLIAFGWYSGVIYWYSVSLLFGPMLYCLLCGGALSLNI